MQEMQAPTEAQSVSMGRKKRPPHPDTTWVELAERATAEHGKIRALAKHLDVHETTAGRLVHGRLVSPAMMMAASDFLGIRPPRISLLKDHEQDALRVIHEFAEVAGWERTRQLLSKLHRVAETARPLKYVLGLEGMDPQMVDAARRLLREEWERLGVAVETQDDAAPAAGKKKRRPA
jgi:hypothetical protein